MLQNPLFGAFVDIVNTYLGVSLPSGLVGLGLFSGFFITVVLGILGAMKRFTVSSISVAGLGVAYARMLAVPATASEVNKTSRFDLQPQRSKPELFS